MSMENQLILVLQLNKYSAHTSFIKSMINKITAAIGIIKLIQSDAVPFGLLFTIARADGNRITIKATKAKAETICIQSISIHPVEQL